MRRCIGEGNKYRVMPLGLADDANNADGSKILNYDQAKAKANAMIGTANGGKIERLTVRQAMSRYVDWKRDEGASVADVLCRGTAHILPALGDLVGGSLQAMARAG